MLPAQALPVWQKLRWAMPKMLPKQPQDARGDVPPWGGRGTELVRQRRSRLLFAHTHRAQARKHLQRPRLTKHWPSPAQPKHV